MNLFKANTKLAARLGPISGIEENVLFTQRVKPLYLCAEKEVRLYALLKGFQIQFVECPYSREGYRHQVQEMINEFENKYKGTKQGIINSFLDILPSLQEHEKNIALDEKASFTAKEKKLWKRCGTLQYLRRSIESRNLQCVPDEGDLRK